MTEAPLKLPPKLTDRELQARLAPVPAMSWLSDWELVINAFGVTGSRSGAINRKSEGQVIGALGRHFEVTRATAAEIAPGGVTPTLAVFLKAHLDGHWVVFINGHVLAIRDGVVHDADREGTVKRKVVSAYRVQPLKPPPGGSCSCSDPLVFGHWETCRLGAA